MVAIERNIPFTIYGGNDEPFYDLVLRKSVVESVAMSLGDKISGDVYYKDNTLEFSLKEYVIYNGVKYTLVNPPTVVREGLFNDNGELNGMTKYSLEFYHPMYVLTNMPFTDVAVSFDELRYKSQDKSFAWIGYLDDYVDKLNKNLEGTEWVVKMSDRLPLDVTTKLSEVLTFDNQMIGDALKTGYDTWEVPFIIDKIDEGEEHYDEGKRFLIQYGLPSTEIFANEQDRDDKIPFVFRFGQGVGLKNNSRTPRNNKIITRLYGYGSENNIPYGYPQIVWEGDPTWDYTINNDSTNPRSYPIYKGIVGGKWVKLIKHPFTRNHLMPTIYARTIDKKVNPLNPYYDPDIEILDYYDADLSFPNPINTLAPSCEIHQFEDIKPELTEKNIIRAYPIDTDTLEEASDWDDTMDLDTGEYKQSYFKVKLPKLDFDIYACAAITQEMQINMRGGACIGCTFNVQVDWDDYKANFYDAQGNFVPDGSQRNLDRYPNSANEEIELICQKDMETFGTLMPNRFQHPMSGDQFVILGISLPLSYVTYAQERLDKESMAYMRDNNVCYFDYPLKFDEFFLTQNTNILSQLKNNVLVYFEYQGTILSLYVKQISVKYGENVLPTYDITLTDDIDVTINQIGQAVEEVSKLDVLLDNLRKDVDVANLPSLLTRSKRDHSVVNYLKQALNQDSEVQGGLLLTTLIALRDENDVIWSGINGAYDGAQASGGIAAWFGGAMVDHIVNPTAEDYAKIVFRFDGSGYLAGGKLWWDTEGNATFDGTINAYKGSIGGFDIATGRIGTTWSYEHPQDGLCVTNDFVKVGDSSSWVSIGKDVSPYFIGKIIRMSATIHNHHETAQPTITETNIGLNISVTDGDRNYGVLSDAPIRATSVYGTEMESIVVTNTHTLAFQDHNLFQFHADANANYTLPTLSQVADMFGFGTNEFPQDFGFTFTIIVKYDSNNINLKHSTNAPIVVGNKNKDIMLRGGEVVSFAIINYPSFSYKMLYHTTLTTT